MFWCYSIIYYLGEPLNFEVQCVVDGYNKQLSKGIPTLLTTLDRTDEEKVYSVDFEDQENKQASWKASFNITKQDKGMQVRIKDIWKENCYHWDLRLYLIFLHIRNPNFEGFAYNIPKFKVFKL